MENDDDNYNSKVQKVVRNKIKKEKIMFKGKLITREVVEKEWTIPKIITTDIGFQMMFGFSSPSSPKKTDSSLSERSVNITKY